MLNFSGKLRIQELLDSLPAAHRNAESAEHLLERIKCIRGAVFDLDGTVLDSAEMWAEVDRQFFARRGIVMPQDYTRTIRSMEFAQTAAYTAERFGLKDTPDEMMREWTELSRDAYANEIALKPHVREFLQWLKSCGMGLAVATSSQEELFMAALKRTGIDRLFDAYATTGEVKAGKNTPAVYCRAAEKLALQPAECAVFEDILVGIQSAARAGFLTVGVFDEGSREQWEAMLQAADLCLKSYPNFESV